MGSERQGDELSASARRAIVTAAMRLGIDPGDFAARCADGEIADLILDLRQARHGLAATDRERIESLLRSLGVLP